MHIIVLARAVCNVTQYISASFSNTKLVTTPWRNDPKARGDLTPCHCLLLITNPFSRIGSLPLLDKRIPGSTVCKMFVKKT